MVGFALGLLPHAAPAQDSVPPRLDYAPVAQMLERFIAHEMADKDLPAISISLVDDQEIVWARGFGFARPRDSVLATAETVYRVGSVSKLFTDIAVLQLVERGALDLDAPLTRYLPGFRPSNPFGTPVTLRHLLTHRSGLVREPPLGSYFDPSPPSLDSVVASLSRTTLVYAPETHVKYSNAAITAVGSVLEHTEGEPFTSYVQRAVLAPLGLTHSAFTPTPDITRHLATAYMWAPDGRRFEAPTFQLGIGPAGSLYSTVGDLGRFVSMLFAGGQGAHDRILTRASLDQMWQPQFADSGATTGFGLGFFVSSLDGHRRVGHDGAVYGFASDLQALPDDRLGVVIVTTLDVANTVIGRIADAALRAMLAVKAGKPIPEPVITSPLPPGRARQVAGRYVRGERQIELQDRAGKLQLVPGKGGAPLVMRQLDDSLALDDPRDFGLYLRPIAGGMLVRGDSFTLRPLPKPDSLPARWAGLVGEYGWDHDILFIYERQGTLFALIEWFFAYPLKQESDSVFAFPRDGLYDGERLVFRRDRRGRVVGLEAAGVHFARRTIGPEGGGQLRVTPVRPVPVLLVEAQAAVPPAESGSFRAPDLVDLASLDSTIRLDIRYATTNNFLGTVFYPSARALLQRPAAEALRRAHRRLRAQGYGLLIHDAYRPWYVTRIFWDATPPAQRWMVANPSRGSRHNRGCAIDLTLYDLRTGHPIDMGGTYDEVTERSYPDYPVTTTLQRWHRELLRQVMEDEGFTRIVDEWWHFDYRDWREYPILNRPFEALEAQ
jgi:CubicO group peptidase (beta-lactamase class C family)/D-alanyl-D-alanine dipeptidase